LNGFTSEELTCYLAKLPARQLGLALDILSDMVLNPLISQEDVEKERTVILEELNMYKDLPQNYVHELLDELLWPRHPLGMSILGTHESIGIMKRDDIRLFKKQYYVPENIVVGVAGSVDEDKFLRKAQDIFLPVREAGLNTFAGAIFAQNKPQLKIMRKETEQTHLALGFHGFERGHPLRHALGLLHIVLGANMSSRLFNEVREKRGLAYEIGTHTKRLQDTGAFVVHAGVDNHKFLEAAEVILQELDKSRIELITEDEFRRAKEFYLGQLMLALEDTLDHMLWIGEYTATLNKTYSLKSIIKEVSGVERKDIREVARIIFKDRALNLALIGPFKGSEDEVYSKLHIGE
jgi:predicted Zn-dependent peptidase